jgi:hypothetical protein
MTPLVVPTDCVIQGGLSANTMAIPAGTVTNAMVNASAAIAASKLQQPVRKTYAQESATNAAAESRTLHLVVGATATIVAFSAGAIVAALTTATATVDLKKNGSSVLSAPISLSNSQTNRQAVAGAVLSTALVVGDVLEAVFTATASGGTLAKGLYCELKLYEDAS